MNSSTDSDLSKGAVPYPLSAGVLQGFVQSLKEKIGPDFGSVCTHEEKREVKRDIARELGVEQEYDPERWPDPADSGAAAQAGWRVRNRYNELKRQGKIEEGGGLTELREWNERIDAHLSGEECFHSEHALYAEWPLEEPSGDPSDGA